MLVLACTPSGRNASRDVRRSPRPPNRQRHAIRLARVVQRLDVDRCRKLDGQKPMTWARGRLRRQGATRPRFIATWLRPWNSDADSSLPPMVPDAGVVLSGGGVDLGSGLAGPRDRRAAWPRRAPGCGRGRRTGRRRRAAPGGCRVDDVAVVEHQDLVGAGDRGQAVGDDDRGAVRRARWRAPACTSASFSESRWLVASSRMTIGGVLQQHAGDGQPLLLAAGQPVARSPTTVS